MNKIKKIDSGYIMEIQSEIQPEKTYKVKMSFLNKCSIEDAIQRLVLSCK